MKSFDDIIKKIDNIPQKNTTPQKTEKKPINISDKEIINDYIKKHKKKKLRLNRKEKKQLYTKEKDPGKSKETIILTMMIVGIIFIFALYQYNTDPWILPVIILIGATMFLPIGAIIGWIIFDPIMRCKILRKTTKNNYGILNLVGKGNKVISKIKNFDHALIWKKNSCWVVTDSFIYQYTKNSDKINIDNKIDSSLVITLIDTVPCIFVDIDSMTPLRLSSEGREKIDPQEIGATLKAWVDNQLAKQRAASDKMEIMVLIAMIAGIAAAGIGIYLLNEITLLKEYIMNLPTS